MLSESENLTLLFPPYGVENHGFGIGSKIWKSSCEKTALTRANRLLKCVTSVITLVD